MNNTELEELEKRIKLMSVYSKQLAETLDKEQARQQKQCEENDLNRLDKIQERSLEEDIKHEQRLEAERKEQAHREQIAEELATRKGIATASGLEALDALGVVGRAASGVIAGAARGVDSIVIDPQSFGLGEGKMDNRPLPDLMAELEEQIQQRAGEARGTQHEEELAARRVATRKNALGKIEQQIADAPPYHDPVNHPKHYCSHPSGIECIEVTEHMPFNIGNAVKYLWRFEGKNGIEDLKKALWYINREIERITRASHSESLAKKVEEAFREDGIKSRYESAETTASYTAPLGQIVCCDKCGNIHNDMRVIGAYCTRDRCGGSMYMRSLPPKEAFRSDQAWAEACQPTKTGDTK